tara:strand:+ start:122 stop:352 length:231 start_codon:yes stop_codon:yes gene_type:complete
MSQSWLGDLDIEGIENITNVKLEDNEDENNYTSIIIIVSLASGLACMKIGYYIHKYIFDKDEKEVEKDDTKEEDIV